MKHLNLLLPMKIYKFLMKNIKIKNLYMIHNFIDGKEID